MTEKFNLAIAGATGNVGREIINILEQRNFPIDNLYLLASSKSKGKKINFRDTDLIVEDLSEFDFSKAHIGLFLQVDPFLQNLHQKQLPKAALLLIIHHILE